MMNVNEKPSLVVVPVYERKPAIVESQQLLQGEKTVHIKHADQYYILRITKENKLILTK